jgi:hypothetical protein
MRILIIGGSGMLGHQLWRHFHKWHMKSGSHCENRRRRSRIYNTSTQYFHSIKKILFIRKFSRSWPEYLQIILLVRTGCFVCAHRIYFVWTLARDAEATFSQKFILGSWKAPRRPIINLAYINSVTVFQYNQEINSARNYSLKYRI